MMNRIFVSLLSIVFVMILSCSGKNAETDASDPGKDKEIPEVLKNDTILNVYEFRVLDTADNGMPLLILFYDKSDLDDPKFEKRYYKSGKLFIEGKLENSKRTGKWIAWYENGVIWSIGNYKNGLKHGLNEAYYENGIMRYSKNYNNDLSEGLGKFYDNEGNLVGEVMYANDTIVWQKEFPR